MNFYLFSDLKSGKNLNPGTLYKSKWCEATVLDRVNGEPEKCPNCGRFVSLKKWEAPRKIELSNSNYPDRLSDWIPEPLVVSQRFVDLYRKSDLIGISQFIKIDSILVKNSKSNLCPPDYYVAMIDFTTNVSIDVQKSNIVGQKYGWSCPICNPLGTTVDSVNRLVLNTDEWNGTDVFRVYGIGVVTSQKFADFIISNRLSNFNLVPVCEYSI